MSSPVRVALLLFDHVDLLDVGGPYEVFLTASRLAERAGRAGPFTVRTVSVTDEPVTAYGGLRLTPSARLADAVGSEVVVVPGAIAIDEVCADATVLSAVRRLSAAATITSSVCTGAFLLGEVGVLAGRAFTTHWEDLDVLADRVAAEPIQARPGPWVDTGPVVTAGGLASGLAMALHLVDRLAGRDLAEQTARQVVFPWAPEPSNK